MRQHLGKARYPAIIVLAAVAVVLFLRFQVNENTNARAAMLPLLPDTHEVAAALYRVGLDPEALTAAGVSPGAAHALIGDVVEHLIVNQSVIELADNAWAQSREQCARLKRKIQSGRATDEQLSAYQTAKLQFAQAKTQRQGVLGALFNIASSGLNNTKRSTLATIQANRHWELPVEFLVVDRTEAQWVRLRNCLANERVAAKLGEDPDPDSQATLAQLRSNPLVAAAKANVDANLAVVTTAWEQAVGQ
jgi:hypothetical protein